MPDDLLTEQWLRASGFKWHQFERQPEKHWLLWLGDVVRDDHSLMSYEDIGIEVAQQVPGQDRLWFCWLRDDCAGKYSRFIHVRHISNVSDLVKLIEAITGQTFKPANAFYGSLHTDEQAQRIRREHDRLDRRLARSGHGWREIERDPDRGGALPEHMQAAIDSGKAQ